MAGNVKIIATSDIHLPHNEELFKEKISAKCESTTYEAMFLLGDIVDRGKISYYDNFFKIIEKCLFKKVVGIFGNDEFEDVREKVKQQYNFVIWLDDEEALLDLAGTKLNIYGTTGVLDVPTAWQRRNVKDIELKYQLRLQKIHDFVSSQKEKDILKILLTHYSPTYKTLHGEPSYAWPQMGSKKVEELLLEKDSIDYALHGHAHMSRVLDVEIGSCRVFNVAFYARKDVFVLEIKKKRTLMDYF